MNIINEPFGRNLLKHFFLDPKYRNVNHGSYGSPPRYVVAKLREYQEQMDFNPEKWIRFTLNEKLNEVRELVGKFVNADCPNIVIVENASDGINSVFKSMLTKPGEKILMFDIAYATAKNTAKFLQDHIGIEIVEVVLDEETLNADDDYLLSKIEREIKNNQGNIKLANIDHIASVPAVILPVKKIIQLLRRYQIPVFIDGAHAVGQTPLDIKDMNPDFYISNFHKWGFNPKSACFLYVAPEYQNKIHPNIISSYYGKGFVNEFAYTGSKDYSSFLTIKDALEFRKTFGEKEILNYIKNLAYKAGEEIAKMWNSEILIRNATRSSISMVNIRIPCNDERTITDAIKRSLFDHNTYIVAFKFSNGNYYARFSAQIYNDLSDYVYSAGIFLEELNKVKSLSLLAKPKF